MKRNGYTNAIARIHGNDEYPNIHGTVRLFQRCDGVLVEAQLSGLVGKEIRMDKYLLIFYHCLENLQ